MTFVWLLLEGGLRETRVNETGFVLQSTPKGTVGVDKIAFSTQAEEDETNNNLKLPYTGLN